jgi:hypothetical protein
MARMFVDGEYERKCLPQHLQWCHGNIWHSFGNVAVDFFDLHLLKYVFPRNIMENMKDLNAC